MEQRIKNIIIASIIDKDDNRTKYELKELKSLAEACFYNTIGYVVQQREKPVPGTYFGSGKLLELNEACKQANADIVIFNDELSPSTITNISSVVENVRIIDRTMLILDIFATRARTKEAKLQVELANLRYMLPRLVGLHQNMSRQGGGSGSSSSKGAGEKALELDRRQIENRIYKIQEDLNAVISNRYTTRQLRKKTETKTVAVVGYTNAGKSTTINSLLKKSIDYIEEKEVYAENMLFATLDTETRRIKLEDNHEFLITDTVGFVERLPHHLVESFKSTLEEVIEADCIVHIIDGSSPDMLIQFETTLEVLDELGCKDIPTIYAISKADLGNTYDNLSDYIPNNAILISNRTKQGLDELLEQIKETIFPDEHYCELLIPYTKGNIVSNLLENAHVHETEYLDNGTLLKATLNKKLYNLYQEYIKK